MLITINSVTYHVRIEGSGPPLLLLHGFTGSSYNWTPFFNEWKEDFKLIALDLIGHGKTDSPASIERYSMDSVVHDIIQILDKLHIHKTFALGYSMGGRIALTLATTYPNRITKLFLESSSPGLLLEEERQERAKRDEALAKEIKEYGLSEFVNKWENIPLFKSQKRLPSNQREELRKQRLSNSPIGLANSLRGMGTGKQKSLWDILQSTSIPTFLLVGELDRKFVEIATAMDKLLPHSKILKVKQAGHAIHVERPDFFGKIVIEWFGTKN